MKRVMNTFEEQNKDNKEEYLEFGTEEGKNILMLGPWIGHKEYLKNRIRRRGYLGSRIKKQLKHSRITKKDPG